MIVIIPLSIDSDQIIASDAPDAPAWTSTGTYDAGDIVTTTSGTNYWEARYGTISPNWWCFWLPAQVNLNKSPTGGATTSTGGCWPYTTTGQLWWEDQGSGIPNEEKMFQPQLAMKTTSTGNSLNVELKPSDYFNSISFLDITATSVNVTLLSATGAELYNTTKTLPYADPLFPAYITRKNKVSFLDLPTYDPEDYSAYSATGPLILTINTASGETVSVGGCALGIKNTIGSACYGTTVGIQDYSRKEFDTFGRPYIIQRDYADTAEFEITVDTNRIGEIKRFLATLRAAPAVYIGDEDYQEMIVYGFYKDLSFPITEYSESPATLEITGLV